ncbi:MAG TPA: cation:proton antiporter [Xanthobacteraceae bacterium]|jgi:NhaP-type Na+/H+ or K+/H+ antiporter|nr:cation:proton antiporter [Xanthobacteraceae bacterium]
MKEALAFVTGGVLVILAAWVPLFIRRIPLSLPMVAVAIGAVLSLAIDVSNPFIQYSEGMEHAAEFALLVAVLGAGLKIDRPFALHAWASTWRLLFPVMVLSIAGIAALAVWLLNLPIGSAILLGAILAPTDPVLAASVQVGPPGVGEEGETKFALTSEAGLNDGLAFPFVTLGLTISAGEMRSGLDVLEWLSADLIWDIGGGAAIGFAVGWLLVVINRRLPSRLRLSRSNSGLVSVGLAFLAYGIAIAVRANGFVAVFFEAVALRNLVSSLEYSRRLNHSAEQFERIAMMVIIAMLGVAVCRGLLDSVGAVHVAFAFAALLIVRPIAVFAGFLGSAADIWTRAAIAYFGIRGIGSLYYLAFAISRSRADLDPTLTAVVGLVVLVSIVFYGTTTDAATRILLGRAAD